jgi:hypothetical protein
MARNYGWGFAFFSTWVAAGLVDSPAGRAPTGFYSGVGEASGWAGIHEAVTMRSTFGEVLLGVAALRGLGSVAAQTADYRAGHNFIDTRVYSEADDKAILKAFGGLRVADVSDGMDFVGLKNTGLMDPAIHALWKAGAKRIPR